MVTVESHPLIYDGLAGFEKCKQKLDTKISSFICYKTFLEKDRFNIRRRHRPIFHPLRLLQLRPILPIRLLDPNHRHLQ